MESFEQLILNQPQCGSVRWIGIAAKKSGPVKEVEQVRLVQGAGIEGEHHFRPNSKSRRQVTLIQHEHLAVVASLLGRDEIPASLLRRNFVVSGINLASLKNKQFLVGDAVLECTGDCVPCELMEQNLGQGGYAAMVGHGGITAVVVRGGDVIKGAPVRLWGGTKP